MDPKNKLFHFNNPKPRRGAAFFASGIENPAGQKDPSVRCGADYNNQFIGSYVPAEHYARGVEAVGFDGTSCQRTSMSDYSGQQQEMTPWMAGHADTMPGASGMSTQSLDALGGHIPYGPFAAPFKSDAADPSSASSRVNRKDMFAGVVIPEPRPIGYLEGVTAGMDVLTTHKNQSYDLRGDIPVAIQGIPTGASESTRGAFALVVPFRGSVY
jgi:hypothetical protein